ncbi:MAG: glycosyltransferase [Planctomycetota bacterium]|jgi:hypothetical protein
MSKFTLPEGTGGLVKSDCSSPQTAIEPAPQQAEEQVVQVHPQRLIHFVWAGGDRIMSEPGMATVKAWAKANMDDGFEAWVWVDKRTDPDVHSKYASEYGITEDKGNIRLKDIEDEGVSSAFVRYEIDRIWPNYGSSSDILRYAILYFFGGAYFDGDVPPGNKTLNSDGVFERIEAGEQVFQVSFISQGDNSIGNDAFICSKRHPTMQRIWQHATEHYSELSYWRQHNTADYSEDFILKMLSTVERTGPTVVGKVAGLDGLLPTLNSGSDAEGKDKPIHVIGRNPDGTVRSDHWFLNKLKDETAHGIDPKKLRIHQEQAGGQNTLGWMKVPLKRFASDQREQALDCALREMEFEITVMHVLRVTDKVALVANALRMGQEVFAESMRLKDYQGDWYWPVPDSPVSASENEIAESLFAGLNCRGLLQSRFFGPKYYLNSEAFQQEEMTVSMENSDHVRRFMHVRVEQDCRYRCFREFYRRIKGE